MTGPNWWLPPCARSWIECGADASAGGIPVNQAVGENRMKYYTVAEIEVTDRGWVSAYVQNVTRMVEQSGGRYLARTSNVEKIEGERTPPQVFLLIEWPSKE